MCPKVSKQVTFVESSSEESEESDTDEDSSDDEDLSDLFAEEISGKGIDLSRS